MLDEGNAVRSKKNTLAYPATVRGTADHRDSIIPKQRLGSTEQIQSFKNISKHLYSLHLGVLQPLRLPFSQLDT